MSPMLEVLKTLRLWLMTRPRTRSFLWLAFPVFLSLESVIVGYRLGRGTLPVALLQAAIFAGMLACAFRAGRTWARASG